MLLKNVCLIKQRKVGDNSKTPVRGSKPQGSITQLSINVLQNEHHDLKQDVVKLQADIVEKDDQILELLHSINKQQQWCRQSNIEIVGLPEAPNENPKTLMVEIAKHAGLELSFDEIEFAHRVQPFQSTPKRPKPLVIKLKDRITKDRILACGKLKVSQQRILD
ncbi:unnamed protein product [Leptidea sinapis]|uniref:Uncharacterized protein n=1 Tax=Leptidea sinapis TaxID=189913 RepID=A0A5E4R2U2_9NEOP|nr:unnamed protein product [Leptidea sinapis]